MVSRESILSTPAAIEKVAVPEWGGDVGVKMMSYAERLAWERFAYGPDGEFLVDTAAVRLLVFTAVGEDGELLFTPDDVAALTAMHGPAVSRLFNVATRLNGLDAKTVDEDVGKS